MQNNNNLSELINRVQSEQILLPDFQRKFVWTDLDMQKKLIASVMAKMPIGSILLLEAQKSEYAYKKIGRGNSVENSESNEIVHLLLDGQQRMTVLTNAFSNVIAKLKFNEMTSPSLRRRFFLKINIDGNKVIDSDIFGINNLDLGLSNPADDEPKFLSGDIFDMIYDETPGDNSILRAGKKNYNLNDIYHFCCQPSYYLIPLFLLTEEDGTTNNEDCLSRIAKDISKRIQSGLKLDFSETKEEEKDKKAQAILGNAYSQYESEVKRLKDKTEADNKFAEALENKAETWTKRFVLYLKSCVMKLNLNQIVVARSQRDRAIDIYENLNKQGKALNIFDLIMARVAKVYQGNYYDRVVDYIKANKTYITDVLPDRNKKIITDAINNDGKEGEHPKHTYNATYDFKCIEKDNDLSAAYIDAFLNVMCLNANSSNEISLQYLKKDEKLKIAPEIIDKTCEQICDALDRAIFFFQTRCGMRGIKDINYNLMLVIVGFLFLDENKYKSKDIHNILEAWYWGSVFSGEFDSDQNNRAIQHLKKLIIICNAVISNSEVDYEWLKTICKSAFSKEHFSTKDFLLMQECQSLGRTPKPFMRDVICQFYLSNVYNDCVNSSVILSAFYNFDEQLEKHHVVPLGSCKTIKESTEVLRGNREHILNSPLNFIYLTKSSNSAISDMKYEDYYKMLKGSCINTLSFTYPFDTSSEEKIKDILSSRYDQLTSKLSARFIELIGSLE